MDNAGTKPNRFNRTSTEICICWRKKSANSAYGQHQLSTCSLITKERPGLTPKARVDRRCQLKILSCFMSLKTKLCGSKQLEQTCTGCREYSHGSASYRSSHGRGKSYAAGPKLPGGFVFNLSSERFASHELLVEWCNKAVSRDWGLG